MGTAIKHPVPGGLKSSFVIFGIWALWRSGLSVRVPLTLIHPVSNWTHWATLRRHPCLSRAATSASSQVNPIFRRSPVRSWSTWPSGQSARMSKITNGGLTPNLVWHRMLYSCTHMVTVGVKGVGRLRPYIRQYYATIFSADKIKYCTSVKNTLARQGIPYVTFQTDWLIDWAAFYVPSNTV